MLFFVSTVPPLLFISIPTSVSATASPDTHGPVTSTSLNTLSLQFSNIRPLFGTVVSKVTPSNLISVAWLTDVVLASVAGAPGVLSLFTVLNIVVLAVDVLIIVFPLPAPTIVA